ncbi:hypothetical protein RhiirA1_401317 [Rhizophagus irregularis]|uniref:Uncharacterized protein n=1 Tax=Rhizophagus irregularis TaxID=588596 RepID=A0A2N0R2T5_9GLOM|nr:hypothetical protein RhiirA1_401317 [Rhizophagus irregularis]
MTDFMKSYCDSNNSEHQIILYKEMEEFNKHFDSNTHTTVRNRVYHFLPPGASTDTSDDTKEIERRPNKRIYASSHRSRDGFNIFDWQNWPHDRVMFICSSFPQFFRSQGPLVLPVLQLRYFSSFGSTNNKANFHYLLPTG